MSQQKLNFKVQLDGRYYLFQSAQKAYTRGYWARMNDLRKTKETGRILMRECAMGSWRMEHMTFIKAAYTAGWNQAEIDKRLGYTAPAEAK